MMRTSIFFLLFNLARHQQSYLTRESIYERKNVETKAFIYLFFSLAINTTILLLQSPLHSERKRDKCAEFNTETEWGTIMGYWEEKDWIYVTLSIVLMKWEWARAVKCIYDNEGTFKQKQSNKCISRGVRRDRWRDEARALKKGNGGHK